MGDILFKGVSVYLTTGENFELAREKKLDTEVDFGCAILTAVVEAEDFDKGFEREDFEHEVNGDVVLSEVMFEFVDKDFDRIAFQNVTSHSFQFSPSFDSNSSDRWETEPDRLTRNAKQISEIPIL
ncbi:hypothetical protein HK096_007782 [Nowakowskiella sp. JEL0078]|nr:hypothetical protein HK096_007782 [Nowakowskiella sp. JEL0078]